MQNHSLRTKVLISTLTVLLMISPLAMADWVAKDGTGSDIVFDGFVIGGAKQLPKHVMTSSTGVQIGTPTNPLVTTLSAASPSSVNATQAGLWSLQAKQSGPWSVSQLNAPLMVSPSNLPWSMSQGGAWTISQQGAWAVGLAAGSNTIGNVGQVGSPWAFNLNQVSGASPLITNPVPILLSKSNAAVGAGNELPVNCISGCTTQEGGQVTYAAASDWTVAVGATDIALLQGSDSKIVKVQKVNMGVTASGGVPINVSFDFVRRTSGNTGGTSQTPVIGKLDKNDPSPTAVFRTYTANPTALGTSAGSLRHVLIGANASGANVNLTPLQAYRFGSSTSKPITLRGSSEYLALNTSTPAQTTSIRFSIEWTEE